MRKRGAQHKIDDELKATNTVGGYQGSIVCTDQGLLVASAGDIPSDEALAGFASLFDENSRLFLVIWMDADATWRRNATRLISRLRELLAPFVAAAAESQEDPSSV
jgi:hypothetical protein